jgi:ribonuclease HI
MSIAYLLLDSDGNPVTNFTTSLSSGTNNMAEYLALIALCKKLSEMKIQDVSIYGDSQLVVNQVNGSWKVNQDHLKSAAMNAQKFMKKNPGWKLSWIPREENLADQLMR